MAETLGSRIKQLREQNGLTQEQVADSIYVSRQALGLYETDNRQPTSDKIVELAHLYHVSTDYLLGVQTGQIINAAGLTGKEWSLMSELTAVMTETNEQLRAKTE